jgi:predicted GNAT superfamily acetyltransferase
VTAGSIEIRTVSAISELTDVGDLLQEVWGAAAPLVSAELLAAIAHSGGYVAGAFDGHRLVGASVGFLADHHGERALHSHVTGVIDARRHGGVGQAIKLHQRAWAADHDVAWITWTFDPLVRRNAWFNIAVLGADVDAYIPSFYGTMSDAINVGDESDRLVMAWDVTAPVPVTPRDGSDAECSSLVPTPADIVELRRSDPTSVGRWRAETREALIRALDTGRRIVGFTRDGNYVIGEHP